MDYAAAYGYGEKSKIVPKFWQEKYEKEANRFWNKFYGNNKTNFFKDRHWLQREFTELTPEETKVKVIEVGCGVGNTLFPLMEENPKLFFYAFDFSSQAVNLLKGSPEYDEKRVVAFVHDISSEDLPQFVKEDSLDFATMIFILSAVSPEKMPAVVSRLFKVLKEGGKVLFRDYAEGDMAQKRFEAESSDKDANKLGDNFYVRGDGTRAYFFTESFLNDLFISGGFEKEKCLLFNKEVENRKEQKHMSRLWIQGVYRKPVRLSQQNASESTIDEAAQFIM